jgi:D-sedoheptulose 7-phosphate isomerase
MSTWQSYVSENARVLSLVDQGLIKETVKCIQDVALAEGIVWVLGNGGSASLASHAVADFSKTVHGLGGSPVRTLAPSEMISLQTAYSNDMEFTEGFASTLRTYGSHGDAVLVISVSGRSLNMVKALEVAKSIGMQTCAWVGTRGAGLEVLVDNLVVFDSDDYQVVENAQVSLMHWVTKKLAS